MQGRWKKVLRVDLSKRAIHTEEFPEDFYINFMYCPMFGVHTNKIKTYQEKGRKGRSRDD